jgi:hypothetical protein
LHSATIGELEWYFEHRLKAARGEPLHPMTQGFLRKGAEVFGAPRFTAMYQRWLKHVIDVNYFCRTGKSNCR